MSTSVVNPILDRLSPELQLPKKAKQRLGVINRRLRDARNPCRLCERWEGRGGQFLPVGGEGRGRIMLVGHRIGRNEANEGRPSIGQASVKNFTLLLDAIAPDVSIRDSEARDLCLDFCYVTNHTRCDARRDAKPSHKQVKTCSKNWLREEIRQVDPVVIVFWHRNSAKSMLGFTPPGNGQMFEANIYGTDRMCMVMNHPVVISQSDTPQTYIQQIQAQYGALAKWLHEEGYLLEAPESLYEETPETEHHLVETEYELTQALNRLHDAQWIGLDTETTLRGAYYDKTAYENDMGGTLWPREGFEVVTVQLCTYEVDGDGNRFVPETFTICTGFRDVAGRLRHELDAETTSRHLDAFFRHAPQGGTRYVAMWNALFDCPVMARLGIDLLGFRHWDYPVQIWDGMLVDGRLNEHLTRIGGLSLDAASQRRGHGGKDSFSKTFDVNRFASEDITRDHIREKLLSYTGKDPQKTILTVRDALDDIWAHVQSIDTEPARSAVPAHGYRPFPRVNGTYQGSRLLDVALPIDHQMIAIISQMSAIGFRLDESRFEELERYVIQQNQQLKQKLRDLGFGHVKPNSSEHHLQVINRAMDDLADAANTLRGPVSLNQLCTATNVKVPAKHRDSFAFDREVIQESYEDVYGDLSAQQDSIEKFLGYLEDSCGRLEHLMSSYDINAELPDVEILQELFETIFLFKQLNKKWKTYFVRFKEIADEYGIVNPSYKLTGTTSWRLSGNFQNIPRGDDSDEMLKKLDVRQFIYIVQSDDINRMADRMNLGWQVKDEPYVGVLADFAAQEDRMAFALTGDETKARLLADPDMDTHFYNASFLFGDTIPRPDEGPYAGDGTFSTSTEESTMEVYNYLTDKSTEEAKKRYKEHKADYRTPVKTVHYARQYGAADKKIHNLLVPIMDEGWTLEDTKRLTRRYDELYSEVTRARKEIMEELDDKPYVEYATFGTLRHAEHLSGRVVQNEYLSVANANNQGTSAGITKYAMIRMRELIYQNAQRWNLVEAGGDRFVGINLQVHDEIGVQCPAALAPEVMTVLESAMRMWVGPVTDNDPIYRDEETGIEYCQPRWYEDGCLYLPDPKYKAPVLFDADGEIKITIAKADELADGTKNLYAASEKEGSVDAYQEEYPPEGINDEYPLVTGYKDGVPIQNGTRAII
jgi:uracil-DNA glycosylase family 4